MTQRKTKRTKEPNSSHRKERNHSWIQLESNPNETQDIVKKIRITKRTRDTVTKNQTKPAPTNQNEQDAHRTVEDEQNEWGAHLLVVTEIDERVDNAPIYYHTKDAIAFLKEAPSRLSTPPLVEECDAPYYEPSRYLSSLTQTKLPVLLVEAQC